VEFDDDDQTKQTFQAAWMRRDAHDVAFFSGIAVPRRRTFDAAPPPMAFVTDITFATSYPHERLVQTSNSSRPWIHPKPPTLDELQCPRVQDVRRLADVHEARKRRAALGDPAPVRDRGIELLRKAHRGWVAIALNGTYYRRDPRTGACRLTFRGACALGWAVVWPGKVVVARRLNRRAAEALHELGFDETGNPLEQPVASGATQAAGT
jgi:hypothetical protein